MKNINTDVVVVSNAGINACNEEVILYYNKEEDYPCVVAHPEDDESLIIEKLNFVLSVNATERKDAPIHDEGDSPRNTIFFDHKYEICIRLTETSSGKFVDLDTFDIEPGERQIVLCRKVFFKRNICQYQNVRVAIPPKGKDLCVLKILIRNISVESESNEWIVQSMHPIRLKIAD